MEAQLALTVTSLCRTVDALRSEIEALRHEARYDALTGLGNRRLLEERTKARDGGQFISIDLNGFKRAQDSHPDGHDHGDAILRDFARHLLSVAGEDDRVACRVGGDEFTVYCPTYRAALVCARAIERWSFGAVTASTGIGSTRATADQRMYEAKKARKEAQ
jgi:diguanylate cyclase (GGDEF)-like protein